MGSGRSSPGSARSAVTDEPAAGRDDHAFVYDTAARFNETVIGTINAIDTALTAILAGDVAALVFSVDKIVHLSRSTETAALAALGSSIALATVGYLVGLRYGSGVAEGVMPRRFVRDFAQFPDESLVGAIEQIVSAGDANLKIRSVKRACCVVSVVSFLAGLAFVVLSGLRGGAVY
jgi:hypothetical protein